jgi:uncharacterized protein (DUF952 family)
LTTFYHLTTAREWEDGRAAGAYTTSTRGRTLEQQGFLHGSGAAQVAPVANSFYADAGEPLVVLVIDSERLKSPWQYDEVPGQPEPYPHIYGPLNPDAVTDVVPLEPGPDGKFAFTPPPADGSAG